MNGGGSKARERLAAVAVAILYIAWCVYYIERTTLTLDGQRVFVLWDDAMVSMRYARNFAEGHGLVWNPGERVQGYSNPGLTLLMALAHELGLGPARVSLALQAVCLGTLLTTIAAVRGLTRTMFDDARLGDLACVVAMACAPLAVLTLQGTDVGPVTASILVALWLAAKRLPERAPPITAFVALAIGVLVRLDVALVYLVLLAFAAKIDRSPRALAPPVALLVVTIGAVLAFGYAYYGDPLPNTYYLKATGCPRGLVLASGLGQLASFFGRMLAAFAVIALAIRIFLRRDVRVQLLVATMVALLAYDVWVGGDWVWEWTSRFLAPVLPISVVLFVGGLHRMVSALAVFLPGESEEKLVRPSAGRRLDLTVLGALLAIPAFGTTPSLLEWLNPAQPTMYHRENQASLDAAAYLRAHVDRDASIAVHWAGIVPYFSELFAVDVLGKCDAHIAHLKVDHFAPGHSKWDWGYVVNERRPDIIDYADRGLPERADFREAYDAVCLPQHQVPSFYLRRTSRAKLHDDDARLVPIGDELRCL